MTRDTWHTHMAERAICDPPLQSMSCERRSRPCLLANTRDSSQRTHANLFWFHQHAHGRHAVDGYQRALARGSCRLPADSDAMRGERSRALPAMMSRPDGGGLREGLLPKKCRRDASETPFKVALQPRRMTPCKKNRLRQSTSAMSIGHGPERNKHSPTS